MSEGEKDDRDDDLHAGEHFMVKQPVEDLEHPDIVDEPSGVIRAMQREAASVVTIPDVPPPPANDVPTDIDLDAVSRSRPVAAPKPVLEYFADGDISDVFDDEPTRPWLDPLPTPKKPSEHPTPDEEDEVEDESTIIGGGYDPSVDRSRELVTIKHGRSLSKLKIQLAQCVADPSQNTAGINFSRLEENIRGIGKTSVLGRRLTLVRTRKNLFLVSNENLVDLQNQHHELMGIDLTKSSLFRTTSGKQIYFTLVTGSDLEVLQKAGTAGGKLVAASQEKRRGHVTTTETLLLPEVTQLADGSVEAGTARVDLEDFKAKLSRASRDPEGIVYADPKVFAERIVFVMPFYDGAGSGHYYITALEGGEELSYLMYVTPRRPQNPDLSYASFLYGDEFCTLVPEE